MRKINAFILAGFYLLLSTGAFACLVHCTSEVFFAGASVKPNSHLHQNKSRLSSSAHKRSEKMADQHHRQKDKCGNGKDCKCCRQHGLYLVRENVSPTVSTDFTQVVTLLPTEAMHYRIIAYSLVTPHCYPQATGPPVYTHIPLYLKFRSILI